MGNRKEFPSCHICGRYKDGAYCARCRYWSCDSDIKMLNDEQICSDCWTEKDEEAFEAEWGDKQKEGRQ